MPGDLERAIAEAELNLTSGGCTSLVVVVFVLRGAVSSLGRAEWHGTIRGPSEVAVVSCSAGETLDDKGGTETE